MVGRAPPYGCRRVVRTARSCSRGSSERGHLGLGRGQLDLLHAIADQTAGAISFTGLAGEFSRVTPTAGQCLFDAANTSLDRAAIPLGDINRDGVVNVTDLLAVIGAWGACP